MLDGLQLDDAVRSLFESLPGVHFFIKDRRGKLIHSNTTHRHSLHRFQPPTGLIGKDNHDFFPAAIASSFAEDDEQVMATGEPLVERIELNLSSDGALRWYCTTKVPARNKAGRIVGLIGVSRRLSESDARLDAYNRFAPAIDHVRDHLGEPIAMDKLAKLSSLSVRHFQRQFKQLFGVSPAQFIIRLRIHEACLRLAARPESIADVAFDCGFNDQNYFARQFKRIMGVTPTQFHAERGVR